MNCWTKVRSNLVTALHAIDSFNPEHLEKMRTEADTRVPCQHLLIGSGVIEAGCNNDHWVALQDNERQKEETGDLRSVRLAESIGLH
jgi:hypothetical protein